MNFIPHGVYKVFTEAEVYQELTSLESEDSDDIRTELSTLHLVELIADGVRENLERHYFFQTENWVWYAPEFLDYATSLPFPKDNPGDPWILLRDEHEKTWKYFLRSDRAVPATESDLVPIPKHPTDGQKFRVVFFLHYFEPEMPLHTPTGTISLPTPTQLPERLNWKDYVYWN